VLNLSVIEEIIEYLLQKGAQFCDARLEIRNSLSITVVNGAIRFISHEKSKGISIRVLINDAWGYASTTDLSWNSVKQAGERALKIAKVLGERSKGKLEIKARSIKANVKADIKINPLNVDLEEKINVAMTLDAAQRNTDKRIVNSNARYQESILRFEFANSFGSSISWEEVRTRIIGYSVAFEAGKIQYSYCIKDGTIGFELIKEINLEEEGEKIAKEAVSLLNAKRPPSGYLTVIADPSVTGVLAHEVMGHASEADDAINKRSFLTGIVGKQVASELITMIDDGTIKGAHGSIPFDSEGTPSSRTVIIEKGIYKGYMHNLETAALMGAEPTGNGRAQDFNRRVFVRMTNTFFAPGDWNLDEIIEDTKFGVLAIKAMGGMEDPVGGGFETKALMGYLIENGEKKYLIRSFTLSGKALEILKTVDAVSKDFELSGGHCGKGEEDIVPVSSGGPYIRAKILVGGG